MINTVITRKVTAWITQQIPSTSFHGTWGFRVNAKIEETIDRTTKMDVTSRDILNQTLVFTSTLLLGMRGSSLVEWPLLAEVNLEYSF